MENFGMVVKVVFTDGNERTFHNVTEVHYNFSDSGQVAIESDFHSNGINIYLNMVKEFDTVAAEKRYVAFTGEDIERIELDEMANNAFAGNGLDYAEFSDHEYQ